MKAKQKIVVILGPTASGKSDLAVRMAEKFNSEIVSADSRQVYKGLDVGSGKITKKEMRGISHHLLDVADPLKQFSVAQFQKQANKAIGTILKKTKVPIVCGGSGFYIQSIVDGIVLPAVKPDYELREKLEGKDAMELFAILMNLDRERAATIDPENPARLIRAIEIATVLGKVPKAEPKPKYHTLQIGIDWQDEVLKERIEKRLRMRLKKGMIEEVENLHAKGVSWERLEELGLEYRYVARFLQGKIGKVEMIAKLNFEIWHFAKRQRTWFKRDKRIIWFEPKETTKIKKEIQNFLS